MARRKPVLAGPVVWPSSWKDEPAPRGSTSAISYAQYQITPKPAPAVTYSEKREADKHRAHQDAQRRGSRRESYVLEVSGHRSSFNALSTATKAYIAAASTTPKLFHVTPYGVETQIA